METEANTHIVRTTAQWQERAVEYAIIPRGCLCVEFTPKGKTKIKVGEGNKYYSQLPYIGDISELNNYYNKDEVDKIIGNLNFMSIASTEEYETKHKLPRSGNKLGDVRFVENPNPSISTEPISYVWNGKKWIPLGNDVMFDIDLSEYVKKKDIMPRIEKLEKMAHTHDNKDILDQIDDPWTKEDREKLDSLENYDDSELRDLIGKTGHTHDNKDILDQIDDPWTKEDREKLDSLHNYDDSDVQERLKEVESKSHTHSNHDVLENLTQDVIDNSHRHNNQDALDDITQDVIDNSHTHENQDILDSTTANFTKEEKDKLERLEEVYDYFGASEEYDGIHGLVPAAQAGEQDKFLKGDGTWADPAEVSLQLATKESPGIVQVGEHLTITEDGILDVDLSGVGEYSPGTGIEFEYTDTGFIIDNLSDINKWEVGSIGAAGDLNSTNRIRTKSYGDVKALKGYCEVSLEESSSSYYGFVFYNENGKLLEGPWVKSGEWFTVPSGYSRYRLVVAYDSSLGAKNIIPDNLLSYKIYWDVGIGNGDGDGRIYIHNTGVIDVTDKEDSVGVITVTTRDGDKDVDLLKNLGKLTFNCNNDPE